MLLPDLDMLMEIKTGFKDIDLIKEQEEYDDSTRMAGSQQ